VGDVAQAIGEASESTGFRQVWLTAYAVVGLAWARGWWEGKGTGGWGRAEVRGGTGTRGGGGRRNGAGMVGARGLSAGSLGEPARRISWVVGVRCKGEVRTRWWGGERGGRGRCAVGAGAERPRAQPPLRHRADGSADSRLLREPQTLGSCVPPAPGAEGTRALVVHHGTRGLAMQERPGTPPRQEGAGALPLHSAGAAGPRPPIWLGVFPQV